MPRKPGLPTKIDAGQKRPRRSGAKVGHSAALIAQCAVAVTAGVRMRAMSLARVMLTRSE